MRKEVVDANRNQAFGFSRLVALAASGQDGQEDKAHENKTTDNGATNNIVAGVR